MGMTTLLSSKLNSDRGSCSRTLVSRTKFFFIDWPGGSLGRDLVVRWGLLLLVCRSIGTEPTRPGRSNAPLGGPEQLLNGPGHRRRGHALPGETPAKASEVEPVGAAPPRSASRRSGGIRACGRSG